MFEIIACQAVGEVAAFGRIALFCIHRGLVTLAVAPAGAGKTVIKGFNHGLAQWAAPGRFQGKQFDHVLAPVLVILAIADIAYAMGRAEHAGKAYGVAQIGLVAQG